MKNRLILTLLITSACFSLFGQVTDAALLTQSNVIRTAGAGENTASRVAAMFDALINSKPNVNKQAFVVASGTDTYIGTISPAITTYTGLTVFVQFSNANATTSPTINFNAIGAASIKKNGNVALAAGDIPNNRVCLLAYDGTNFQILGSVPVDASGSVKGVVKLYTATGSNTDGTMDQNSITTAIAGKLSPTLAPGHLFVGNGSSVATDVAMSGDISMSSAGVTTYNNSLPVSKLNGGSGASATTVWTGNATWTHKFANSAINNELIASDGTDGVGSGVFVTSSNHTLGSTSISGTNRDFTAESISSDVNIRFFPKGLGLLYSQSSGGNYWSKTGSGVSDIGVHSVWERTSSGTVANGFGFYNSAALKNGSGFVKEVGREQYSYTDVTNNSEDALIDFQGIRNGTLSTAWSWNNNNFSFFTNTGSYGGGENVIKIPNALTIPTTSVTGGGVFYVNPADSKPYWWTGTTAYSLTGGGGGGSSTFTSLTDGPGAFTGKTLNFVRVNTGETSLEYQTPSQVRTALNVDLIDNTSDATKNSATATLINKTIAAGSNTITGITNSNLSGTAGITNSNLANSSITIAGNAASLGGSVSLDNITGLSSAGIIKRTGANTLATAVSGTDYAPATSGSSILRANGSGGFSNAVSGTDYQAPLPSQTGNANKVLQTDGTNVSWQAPTNSITINTQTASYTLAVSDAGSLVRMNSASPTNLTVAPNSSVALPVGAVIRLERVGAGNMTVVAGAGVTINPSAGVLTDPGQVNFSQRLTQIATNVWDLQNGTSLSSLRQSLGVINRVAIHAINSASLVSTNQPNSEQPIAVNTFHITRIDNTNYRQVRVNLRVSTASTSANSPRCYPQYTTDGGSTWITVGAGTVASGDAIVYTTASTGLTTNWITIPAPAQADVLWRLAENGGDGVSDPAFSAVFLEFRM